MQCIVMHCLTVPVQGPNWRISVTLVNAGPDPATNMQVAVQLPQGWMYQWSQANRGAYGPGVQTWTIDNVPVGTTDVPTLQIGMQGTHPEICCIYREHRCDHKCGIALKGKDRKGLPQVTGGTRHHHVLFE